MVGAGIGGLAAALRLARAGALVTVFDRHKEPGGKMHTVPSSAGPVDAGPTVLTMKPVFDKLFADVGARLEHHVTLDRESILARHFWLDGTSLDLMADHDASLDNIATVFDARAAREFEAFCERTARLYKAFEAPMIHADAPSLPAMTGQVIRSPALIGAMTPHQTLARMLQGQFTDPRLAQLFGRYATYVGGLPDQVPALLCLIWEAERRGVWHVRGGMHRLARAIADLASTRGVRFRYGAEVQRIEVQNGRACAVVTKGGRMPVDAVLFNGDPKALRDGLLGVTARVAVADDATAPRSLSAHVASFAATATPGFPLTAHNVFFARDPQAEYAPLARGQCQTDPTLYVCAQDRFGGAVPNGPERFEVILNAPPLPQPQTPQETPQCHTLIFNRLMQHGLRFSPTPDAVALTGPVQWRAMFPGSDGSLYGRSPAGMLAAFKRPTARTRIPGLYLAGGGTHPGAGVPMATISGGHAAAAMIADLGLTSMFRPADMPGGISTA